MKAVCSLCGFSFVPSPSSVTISSRAPTEESGRVQDRTGSPLMCTVQEPHWPRPHPKRGPCSPASLRKTYSSGVAGSSTVAVTAFPFTRSVLVVAIKSLFLGNICVRLYYTGFAVYGYSGGFFGFDGRKRHAVCAAWHQPGSQKKAQPGHQRRHPHQRQHA